MFERQSWSSSRPYRWLVEKVFPLKMIPREGSRWRQVSKLMANELLELTSGKGCGMTPIEWRVEYRGIPHLAKNERDVGHPIICCRY